MSTTLTRIQIGQVDVVPGDVRMVSDESYSTITTPGFLNSLNSGINILPTDIITAVYGTLTQATIFKTSFNGNIITLIPVAGGSGEVNVGNNLGSGVGAYAGKTGVALDFYSFAAGDNATVVLTGNEIVISAIIPPGGEANTASNLGVGAGLFASKVGVDLQFKSVIAGSGIDISTSGTALTFSATGAGDVTDGLNLGVGEPVFTSKSGSLLQFNTLVAGSGVTITPIGEGGGLEISATGEVVGGVNLGGGLPVFNNVSGSDLTFNTFAAGSNIGISLVDNVLTIDGTASSGVTNGVNIGAGDGVFSALVGTDLQFKTLVAGSNITLTPSSTEILISASGGGGGGFAYENAFWVAQNGNDSNSGLSIDSPKLTIQGAIDAITATTSPNTIIIEDSGAYVDDFTITLPGLSIFAPNATVSTATITMSANSGVGPTLYGNQLVFRSWDGVTYNDTSITRLAAYDEVILNISNMTNSTNLSMGARNTNIVANLFDVNTCTMSVSNAATLISLNISETASNSISVLYNPLLNLDFASWVNVTGNIGKIDLATGAAIGTISLAQNIDPIWFNSIVLFTPSGDINLSFPDSVDAIIPIGWETIVLRNGGSGNVNFVAPGAVTLLSPYNNPETAGNASVVFIRKVASQLYILSGDLQNNSGGEVSQIFVSQETGSDVTGNGSYTKPYASIGAGVTAAGTPTTPTSIFIIDGATYIEAVTVSNPNIYIIGPEALLLNNIGGDALTFTTNATQHFVNLGGLSASGGGSALVNSGTSLIVSTGEVIDGPIQTVNGQIFIRAAQLTGSFASIGSGFIRYTTVLRNGGTDGTNVVGSNSSGTLGNWNVGTLSTDSAGGNVCYSINSPNVTFSNLASSGKVNILTAPVGTARYKVDNILVSGINGTNFDALGDRDLVITDGTSVWTTITAASLKTIAAANYLWGSTTVPLPTTIALNQLTTAGNNIYAAYANGTTDYVAGVVEITLQYDRLF